MQTTQYTRETLVMTSVGPHRLSYRLLRMLEAYAPQVPLLTVEQIAAMLRADLQEVEASISQCVADKWLSLKHHRLYPTITGREELARAARNWQTTTAERGARWKSEALSGITQAGKQSKITRAALPGDTFTRQIRINEEMCDVAMKIRKTAEAEGVPIEELLAEYWDEWR